jgi:hypothetical protein
MLIRYYVHNGCIKLDRLSIPLACARTAGANYSFTPRADIKNVGDFACNHTDPLTGRAAQHFCFASGTLNEVTDACSANELCVAFVTSTRGNQTGAYLKTQAGPVSSAVDTSVYVFRTGMGSWQQEGST